MRHSFQLARRRYLFLLLVVAVDASVFASSAPPAKKKTEGIIAFVDVNLIPMDREAVVRNQTVIVRGGKIAEIGPASAVAVPTDARVIEGTGRYLMPGLADMHVHLNAFVQARPNFGDAPLFLAYGITTVLNLSGDPELLACRQRIRNGELPAPNLYTSGEFINEPRQRTPDEVEREVVRQFHEGYDVIKYHQIVDADGRYITTSGLVRPAYLRMNDVARRLGMPLLGHAPINLGLDALLEAHQSLAHMGEFIPLYFLPPDPRYMTGIKLVSTASLLVLVFSCLCWIMMDVLRRVRKAGSAVRSMFVTRFRRMTFAITSVGLSSMVLSLALILSGNGPLLMLATVLFLVMVALTIRMFILAARGWRLSPPRFKFHSALLILAAVAFVSSTAYWVPILWRSSNAEVADVAASARSAGIWVETTLNLYDTACLSRQQRAEMLQEPAFKALSPEIRDDWTAVAAQGLLPQWQRIVFRNYPQFTRGLTAALNKAGVPLLLGTDSLGYPLAIPGFSAHQELQLLIESGLTPYDALRTATVNPAKFLRKEDEFGTIAVGKRADLLLVSADPLVDIHTLKSPIGVMVRGKWLPAEELQSMLHSLAQQN
jgi:hypothetical protein